MFKGLRTLPQYTPKYELNSFKIPPQVKNWMDTEMVKKERAKCLMIIGPTRIGKTEMVRHIEPKSHMYFRSHFNYDKWDQDAKLIIFDDIEWQFIPNKKALLTQMGEAEITDKYRHKRTIHVTMPAIVLMNDMPQFTCAELAYWNENMTIVTLGSERLYRTPDEIWETDLGDEEGSRDGGEAPIPDDQTYHSDYSCEQYN